MKTMQIPLTKGKFAIIDAGDYPLVSKYKWHALESRKGNFYASANIKNKKIFMHRIILNPPKGLLTDHKNRNGLDNRRSNLRSCTKSQNAANSQRLNKKHYKGVEKHRRKWQAKIFFNGNRIFLGSYDHEIDAAIAYDEAAEKYFGEFACPNFSRALSKQSIARKIKRSGCRIFNVTFIKRTNGKQRKITGRMNVSRGVKKVGMNFRPESKGLIIVFDMHLGKYRAVPAGNIRALRLNGKSYRVRNGKSNTN